MASINKTSLEPIEPSRLDEPLNPPGQDDSQVLSHQNKDIILKFSGSKPYVDTTKAKDCDSNYMVTETSGCKPQNPSQLWFDDVSPTSSNNVLSDDDNVAEEKVPEGTLTTIINTVKTIFFFLSIFFPD